MKKVIIPIIMVILIVLGGIGLTNKITHKKETPKETEKIIKPTKEKETYKIENTKTKKAYNLEYPNSDNLDLTSGYELKKVDGLYIMYYNETEYLYTTNEYKPFTSYLVKNSIILKDKQQVILPNENNTKLVWYDFTGKKLKETKSYTKILHNNKTYFIAEINNKTNLYTLNDEKEYISNLDFLNDVKRLNIIDNKSYIQINLNKTTYSYKELEEIKKYAFLLTHTDKQYDDYNIAEITEFNNNFNIDDYNVLNIEYVIDTTTKEISISSVYIEKR